jgi:hypothetical protein
MSGGGDGTRARNILSNMVFLCDTHGLEAFVGWNGTLLQSHSLTHVLTKLLIPSWLILVWHQGPLGCQFAGLLLTLDFVFDN